jgi:predicted alpha-1,2-mannosidase
MSPLRIGGALLLFVSPAWAAVAPADLTAEVDPFIGTDDSHSPHPVPGGAGGSTFPGATAPFGMIQWSPDTPTGSPSGFRYRDERIEGFSLTHFNGAGCPNNEDLPVMPFVGPLAASPGAGWAPFVAPYRHATEAARPGSYAVTLDPSGTRVELTATTRTGFGRFTYPPSAHATVLLDVSHHATGAKPGSLAITGIDQVAGTLVGGNFCGSAGTFPIFFAIQFDRPFAGFGVWNGKTLSPGARATAGLQAGGYLVFDTRMSQVVQMKVALSYVSAENAWRNLMTESPGWRFEEVRAATAAAWNERLGRVAVTGGTAEERRAFYTALYHVFQNPAVASDVNGEYRDYDERVRTAPHVTYQNFSGWDIYRSWIQLVAVLAPRETSDILQSMVEAGRVLGHLPKWSHQNREANVMNGDPGALIVANGHAFGARDFDARAALALMNRSGSQLAIRAHLGSYLRAGYLPDAATTLENTSADFAVSRFARALGDAALAGAYARRARRWELSFNPATGYIQPRNADGSWRTPFDPASDRGFVEGNAAQYTFMVPYDLPALFEKLGGPARAIARLDHLFRELNAGTVRPHFYIGNEPQFATPWAYHFAGAPAKGSEVVRRILGESFGAGPGGLPGNDDLGATSSWYVWAALGLYPAVPGTDLLALHAPLFPAARITLAGGRALEIRATGAGRPDTPFVQSLEVNGRPSTRAWLHHAELAGGGTLAFTLGPRPDPRWGTAAADAPPRFREADGDVARGKRATSSAPCGPAFGPEKAVDGSIARATDKWCSRAAAPWLQVDLGETVPVTGFLVQHAAIRGGSVSDKWCSLGTRKWLAVDLGTRATLSKVVVRHAGSGGENPTWNTRDFKISVSGDGRSWTPAAHISGNRENVTTHPLPGLSARHVRLDIVTPTRSKDAAARIYELEVYDDRGANVSRGKRATADASCNASEGPEKAVDGDEEPEANTRDFNLQVSLDGKLWTQVVNVRGNSASQTSHPIAPTPARHVRLDVVTPSSDGSPTARIYELEVVAENK